jgi:hypothetical protein
MLREFISPVPFPALRGFNGSIPLDFLEKEVNSRKPILEQEVERTEEALKALGVDIYSAPATLSNIDQVKNFERATKSDILLSEVIGMPNTGKDTFIGRLCRYYHEGIVSTLEPYEFLTKHDERFRQFHGQDEIGRESSVALGFLLHSYNEGRTIITNRSSMDYDIVWRRTYFLAGLSMSWDGSVLSELKPTSISHALYIFLAKPDTSLQRELKGAHGPVMNEKFLTILYSQYLRLIYELRDRKNLTVINMSGTMEENYRKFLDMYQQVFSDILDNLKV